MASKTIVLKLEYDGDEDIDYKFDEFIDGLINHDYDYMQAVKDDLDYYDAKIVFVNDDS